MNRIRDLENEVDEMEEIEEHEGPRAPITHIMWDKLAADYADLTRQLEEAKKESERLVVGWKQTHRDMNSHFDQSCQNLNRAVSAEKQLAEAKDGYAAIIQQLHLDVAERDAEIVRANDGIGYWTKQCVNLVFQVEIANAEIGALMGKITGLVDETRTIADSLFPGSLYARLKAAIAAAEVLGKGE